MTEQRPPLPPFTRDSAIQKVRAAEDGWNSRDAEKVALAYTVDSEWRNRSEFVHGRGQIVELENRIAVRFAYEWCDDSGNWFRSYGNENWEFDKHGLMQTRYACINDLPISESERLFHWPQGHRPDDHPGLSDLGL
ncbi:MAG: nuclear transport factor 2 family protein [Klebsiella pneumoniae]|nr:nuclear transport factor 2 family protein [Klebsiella pneumoniae]